MNLINELKTGLADFQAKGQGGGVKNRALFEC